MSEEVKEYIEAMEKMKVFIKEAKKKPYDEKIQKEWGQLVDEVESKTNALKEADPDLYEKVKGATNDLVETYKEMGLMMINFSFQEELDNKALKRIFEEL